MSFHIHLCLILILHLPSPSLSRRNFHPHLSSGSSFYQPNKKSSPLPPRNYKFFTEESIEGSGLGDLNHFKDDDEDNPPYDDEDSILGSGDGAYTEEGSGDGGPSIKDTVTHIPPPVLTTTSSGNISWSPTDWYWWSTSTTSTAKPTRPKRISTTTPDSLSSSYYPPWMTTTGKGVWGTGLTTPTPKRPPFYGITTVEPRKKAHHTKKPILVQKPKITSTHKVPSYENTVPSRTLPTPAITASPPYSTTTKISIERDSNVLPGFPYDNNGIYGKDGLENDDDVELGNDLSILGRKQEVRPTSFFGQPGMLAAVIGGAVVGLLCAILLVMYIVYRMRRKDEISYANDEPKMAPLFPTTRAGDYYN